MSDPDTALDDREGAAARLELQRIRVEFRTRAKKGRSVTAANSIDLTINRGEIVGVVGESGSGKTTLGRVMAGLLVPDSGAVSIDGRSYEGRGIRPGFGRKVQMVFQSPAASLNPKKTIRRILTDAARRGHASAQNVGAAVAAAMDEVGVTPPETFLGRFPHELSGGQQQRIALARALLHEPEYLVADEPTSALDVSVRVQIIDLIREVQRQRRMGVMFITHDLSVVGALADRVAVMYQGDIVESASVSDVFTDPQHEYTRTLLGSTPRLTPPSGVH
ncbi:ABC transporter ATP-binding protein [Nakamurella lactea]|uniref:ABC transporter ATP-binding protein n=1 Tax=Nakamurella lactea TaxID=459515 RepID=UPI000412EF6B|nr:ABC transporter ATP-binding protein [Nakamurella lactea]